MAARLPAVLAGNLTPNDALESLAFGELCIDKKRYGAAAQLFAMAFQVRPELADDMDLQHRFHAAATAALAGAGTGMDVPPLDVAGKARWRKQAKDWLNADLAALSKISESGSPQARQEVFVTLQRWKIATDLKGIRDEPALAKLPPDEQKACRALWVAVDALLAKVQGNKPEPSH